MAKTGANVIMENVVTKAKALKAQYEEGHVTVEEALTEFILLLIDLKMEVTQ